MSFNPTSFDPTILPADLPKPVDDGAADHLVGMRMPSVCLPSTLGGSVDLGALPSGRTVIFAYPKTGQPGVSMPEGWDDVPGARGCTPHNCGFRDLHEEFLARDTSVLAVSTQTTDYQREMAERLHVPYAVLSDADFRLADALRLPTFEIEGTRLLKRLTLIVRNGTIEHVIYPVFPPDRSAEETLEWLKSARRAGLSKAPAADKVWAEMDSYLGEVLGLGDPVLEAALAANKAAGLPGIDVSPAQGKFLELLVRLAGAKRVLEIGTLGGYSTICLARGAGESGRVVTLEIDPHHAEVATSNLRAAGVLDRVEVRVGSAVDTLAQLERDGAGPFDLIFIDADKESTVDYATWALELSRPGTVILVDNVVRDGKVAEAESDDGMVQGIRRFFAMAADEPRLDMTALQTVGAKGYDGLAMALVRG